MDSKIEIKLEHPLSDDVASQDKSVFFTKNITRNKNSGAMLLGHDYDVAIKSEIKPETAFPELCSQKEKECFTKHLQNQIMFETVTLSKYYDMNIKIDIDSQKERECLPKDLEMKVKNYNSDHEMDNKIDIKEEPRWMESESSSVYDDIKDGDFTAVKSPRSYTGGVSGDSWNISPLHSAETSRLNTNLSYAKDSVDSENQESDITKILPVKKHVLPEQSDKCDGQDICSVTFIHKDEKSNKPNICDKSFNSTSLKRHNVISEGKKPHKCEICEKRFTRLSSLKTHNLLHEGKKPHKCKICEKSFTQLSHLNSHNLMHEGRKPHMCVICEKRFSSLSYLKMHYLIHEGKKPHKCKICDKSFTQSSQLKSHSLIHEGRKPHKCNICEKKFTTLSYLKLHYLIHEGKKPRKCEICERSFTHLSDLKRHILIHEGKKRHKCEICEKMFLRLSHLKSHNLIHEGTRPHKCEICEKKFLRLSHLKRHNLIHEDKNLTS